MSYSSKQSMQWLYVKMNWIHISVFNILADEDCVFWGASTVETVTPNIVLGTDLYTQ